MDEAFGFKNLLKESVFNFGNFSLSLGNTLLAAALLGLLFLFTGILLYWRSSKRQAANEAAALEQTRETEQRIGELVATQNELTGRLMAMNEALINHQSDHTRTVNDNLETMREWIGKSISETNEHTHSSLANLQERLAVIDSAQDNITSLTGKVVELQNILGNKQARGAFGEARLQAIIEDSIPHNAYQLQATLSNGSRPDCLISMPNDMPSLVIDSKFPLESWKSIENASNQEEQKQSARKFQNDVTTHIKAISEKYLIPGETHDTAFMFVPSESIFAEIHEKHESLIEKAHRARILIVSPSLLMLSIQVIRSLLKDTRMREQAHQIKVEVSHLKDDVTRLSTRVENLNRHFNQAQGDIREIKISSERVTRLINRIESLEFSDQPRE